MGSATSLEKRLISMNFDHARANASRSVSACVAAGLVDRTIGARRGPRPAFIVVSVSVMAVMTAAARPNGDARAQSNRSNHTIAIDPGIAH
ncbi:hypothetical protein [Pendulispora albinea]|uniref:Uncharacterized protein n=1 Tax=Pendulispora albinea TaxID=2741071 RepID=A0ABZ2MC60_9BACT